MWSVDYKKVDSWIKRNGEGSRFDEFNKKYPRVTSRWTFEKRRRIVLGLPLSPSMQRGYRAPGRSGDGTRTRNSCIYSTVLSLPVSELEGKTGIEVIQVFTEHLNSALKLGLEAVQMTLMGNGGTQMVEIRRYTK